MADESDEDLLTELGATIELKPDRTHTPREERVIAGFEDILRFVETHGRAPMHGEDRDIFERLYAVRLDRLRAMPEFYGLLAPLDTRGLLSGQFATPFAAAAGEVASDDDLLAELGFDSPTPGELTELRHVRPAVEKRAVEEIANRAPCPDFKSFKPLFERVQKDLDTKIRITRRFGENADVRVGEFFILGGILAYVADMGKVDRTPNGELNARLRVIFGNGTESNLLLRSLQRALYKDEAGRRVTEPSAGPLFGDQPEPGDVRTGLVYVLRSQSDHPFVAANRAIVHKIGVTSGGLESRVAGAEHQSTYLLAGVEVARTYPLFNLKPSAVERLIHQIFAPARLDLEIADRFGNPVKPREWFLVPLHAIDEAVKRIVDGSIVGMAYDPGTASLKHDPA